MHLRRPVSSRLPRLTALVGATVVSLAAATASAAQPAPGPAPASSTAEVAAPADGTVVVVSTTTAPAPAPAPAPVAVAAPAPAPAVAATTDVRPAPEPVRADLALSAKRAEKGKALGLAIAGWSMFGSTYLVSALVGTVTLDTTSDPRLQRYGTWMTVPVAGPFAAAFNSRSATGTLFTTTLGVAQAAGITMALVGTIRHRRAKRDLRLMAMPTRDGGQVGLSMRF